MQIILLSLVVPAVIAGQLRQAQLHLADEVENSVGPSSQVAQVDNRTPPNLSGAWIRGYDEGRQGPSTPGNQIPLLGSIPVTQAGVIGSQPVGKLPALGWNSWNAFHCDISEDKFISAAKKLVELGLQDVGYEYVNIDDCWSVKDHRDANTKRMLPDLSKFPDGINGTAKKIHDMGLKIGIYSSAGTQTCAGYPASIGYEDIDAQTWADWGIDYIKYDNCYVPSDHQDPCQWCIADADNHQAPAVHPNGTCNGVPGNFCKPDYDWSQSPTAQRYKAMRDAIQKTGRPMLYSLCEWGEANVQTWGNQTAQSWRSTGDIESNWPRIKEILNENSFYMNCVNFYGHSDPDMLEIGNGDLTDEENRSHFALWAIMKSPLLIGTDLDKLSSDNVDILKNKYLLSFSQDDVYGAPATPYKWGTNPNWTFNASFPAEFWSGSFKQGTLVAALNTADSQETKEILWSEVPQLSGKKSYHVVDAWTGKDLGCLTSGIDLSLTPHDTGVIIVTGECNVSEAGFIAKDFSS